MSYGERSCKHSGECPVDHPDPFAFYPCDVNCGSYEWDGETDPDSEKWTPEEKARREREATRPTRNQRKRLRRKQRRP